MSVPHNTFKILNMISICFTILNYGELGVLTSCAVSTEKCLQCFWCIIIHTQTNFNCKCSTEKVENNMGNNISLAETNVLA